MCARRKLQQSQESVIEILNKSYTLFLFGEKEQWTQAQITRHAETIFRHFIHALFRHSSANSPR